MGQTIDFRPIMGNLFMDGNRPFMEFFSYSSKNFGNFETFRSILRLFVSMN